MQGANRNTRRKRLRLAGPCGKDFIKGVVGSGPSRTGWVGAAKKKKEREREKLNNTTHLPSQEDTDHVKAMVSL